MKRNLGLFFFILSSLLAIAQTQQGVVKTRGRMANGVLQPGQRLSGATVQVKNRSAVVSKYDGTFAFPVPGNTFLLQSVKKQGYELVDMEICHSHQYSANPLCLLMETPEQQRSDLLAAERNIRRNLQRQLQQKEDEIESLNISIVEKDKQLQELYQNQGDNEKLIAEMAQRYATIDYDQMDDFYRQVSFYIEQGELTCADSLLRLRGDLNGQISSQLHKQEALHQKKKELAKAESVLHAENEELARRCLSFFDSFCLQHQNDSAAHYIDLRATIDTTCLEWQFDAANFYTRQNNAVTAQKYYKRILAQTDAVEENCKSNLMPIKAATLNNLGLLYEQTGQTTMSMSCYLEALSIRNELAIENHEAFLPLVAQTKTNLGMLYTANSRISDGEEMLNDALDILEALSKEHPKKYLPAMAATMSRLSTLYMNSNDAKLQTLAHDLLTQALTSYRHLAQFNPQRYESDVAATLSNLTLFYYQTDLLAEIRSCYSEAIAIYSRLAKDNPPAYLPILTSLTDNLRRMALELNNRGFASDNELQPERGKRYYEESLSIYQELSTLQSDEFRPYVARELGNLSFNAILMKEFAIAENYARQGLTTDSNKLFIYANLSETLILQGKMQEAEAIIKGRKSQLKPLILDDFKKLEERGIISEERENDVRHIIDLLNSDNI